MSGPWEAGLIYGMEKVAAGVLTASFGAGRWAVNKGAAQARKVGQTARTFKTPSPGKTSAEGVMKKSLGNRSQMPKVPAQTRLSPPASVTPQPDVAMGTRIGS